MLRTRALQQAVAMARGGEAKRAGKIVASSLEGQVAVG
jgi:hypothetical protein